MDGLIAIPVHNEEENLPRVLHSLLEHFSPENLLFVDDGSKDRSVALLEQANVPYLKHPFCLGYEETLRTAMEFVMAKEYGFIAFIDGDGQHRVEDLERIIELYENNNYDFILGSRYKGTKKKLSLRSLGTLLFSKLTTLFSGVQISDATCGLKLIAREHIPVVLSLPTEDMHLEMIVGLARRGAHIHEEKISCLEREKGESMYTLFKTLFYPAKTMLCLLAGLMLQPKVNPNPNQQKAGTP